ncbi:transposase [Nocardiopsis oceani]
MRDLAAPRKYPDELRERATRMTLEARRDPATRDGAIARTADQLGINRETLRNWVSQAEIDTGDRPGTTRIAKRLASLEHQQLHVNRCRGICVLVGGRWWPPVTDRGSGPPFLLHHGG